MSQQEDSRRFKVIWGAGMISTVSFGPSIDSPPSLYKLQNDRGGYFVGITAFGLRFENFIANLKRGN